MDELLRIELHDRFDAIDKKLDEILAAVQESHATALAVVADLAKATDERARIEAKIDRYVNRG